MADTERAIMQKTERSLTTDTANKIADALGAPKSAWKVELVLDWRKGGVFKAKIHYWPTDEQGRLIVEAIEAETPANKEDARE